jgi:soluble lytic murein transglycosylase-like protein
MTNEFDVIFERAGIDYHVKPLLLKAIALRESNLDPKAYRYEPDYWENYLKYLDAWKDQVPTIVAASYGLMQILFTTASGLGFVGTAEELYDPAVNIDLGAKLLKQLLDKVLSRKQYETFPWLSPLSIVLAQYNGGSFRNPDMDGKLRNQPYADRVLETYIYLERGLL